MWILLMLQVVTLLIEYSYFNRHVWKLAQSTNIQFCLTFGDPMDCSQPGSSLYEILHTRTLKWVAILFSRGSSQSRDRSHISCIASRFFTVWTTREDQQCYSIICQINMQMPISEKVILSFVYIFLMCTSPQFLYFYWIKNHREKKNHYLYFQYEIMQWISCSDFSFSVKHGGKVIVSHDSVQYCCWGTWCISYYFWLSWYQDVNNNWAQYSLDKIREVYIN